MNLEKRPNPQPIVAVVVPSYRVKDHILDVISRIGPEVRTIYCIDDACPDGSGDFIEANCRDPRVAVLRHPENLGVGGAVCTGYRRAIGDGADIVVKVDGDGQMDPALIPLFVGPIARGEADYTKGNRFWSLSDSAEMPLARRIGNLGLSFLAKASTGYWDMFDPTNGYTAAHTDVLELIPLDALSRRYFFETDILFRLSTVRAVVVDVPMRASYGSEVSNLKISSVFGEFLYKHLRNLGKRVFYKYFLRDLPLASLELVASMLLLGFGIVYGGYWWSHAASAGEATPVGTIMVSTVAVISGLQFFLAFLGYDIATVPRRALHPLLRSRSTKW